MLYIQIIMFKPDIIHNTKRYTYHNHVIIISYNTICSTIPYMNLYLSRKLYKTSTIIWTVFTTLTNQAQLCYNLKHHSQSMWSPCRCQISKPGILNRKLFIYKMFSTIKREKTTMITRCTTYIILYP